MVRLILDLPDNEWTNDLVVSQIDRYRECWEEHVSSQANRDWVGTNHLNDDMREIADEFVEAAVMRGSWRVEEAHDGD